MFCDKVKIKVKAGKGGDGLVSFLHEKYKEYGGPDGGDGGKGGDVILETDKNLNTLYYFKSHHFLKAEDGKPGKKRKSHGKNGKDLIVKVPEGTVVLDKKSYKKIADMAEEKRIVIARGGEGGYGNAHFTSSTRQAPQVAELGEPGEEKEIILEMKMIADVGFIGLPNVGKSTLLSVLSAARPKIADYEFTTIIPNIGVVEPGKFGAERGFIAADIPGLIEGASKGRGLGDEFLRHIERTKILVHFLDATHDDLRSDYLTIRKELKNYKSSFLSWSSKKLLDLPEIVIINKIDAISEGELSKKMSKAQEVVKSKIIPISAVAHKNINNLIYEIERKLAKVDRLPEEKKQKKVKIFTLKDIKQDNLFEVVKRKNYYEIRGKKIEKIASKTDFNNKHSVNRLRDVMDKMGVNKELKRQGALTGDKIKIGGKEFKL